MWAGKRRLRLLDVLSRVSSTVPALTVTHKVTCLDKV